MFGYSNNGAKELHLRQKIIDANQGKLKGILEPLIERLTSIGSRRIYPVGAM